MLKFIPYFDEENQDLIAYDVFVGDNSTPMGHIEMREGEVAFITNDRNRWFDVLSANDLREIASYMEENAVFSETFETKEGENE